MPRDKEDVVDLPEEVVETVVETVPEEVPIDTHTGILNPESNVYVCPLEGVVKVWTKDDEGNPLSPGCVPGFGKF